jgi:hypothetical protein
MCDWLRHNMVGSFPLAINPFSYFGWRLIVVPFGQEAWGGVPKHRTIGERKDERGEGMKRFLDIALAFLTPASQ